VASREADSAAVLREEHPAVTLREEHPVVDSAAVLREEHLMVDSVAAVILLQVTPRSADRRAKLLVIHLAATEPRNAACVSDRKLHWVGLAWSPMRERGA